MFTHPVELKQSHNLQAIKSFIQSKMVWGLMPGHHDAGNEYTSLDDIRNATEYAKYFGLGGTLLNQSRTVTQHGKVAFLKRFGAHNCSHCHQPL